MVEIDSKIIMFYFACKSALVVKPIIQSVAHFVNEFEVFDGRVVFYGFVN